MLKKPRAREYFSIKYCFAGEEEKIPHVLDSYVKNQLDLSDINRVLELSSIKQFFDKYDHVNGWHLLPCQHCKQNAGRERRSSAVWPYCGCG